MERFLLSSDAEIELKISLSSFLVFSDKERKRRSNNDSESQPPHCAFTNAHFLQENLEFVFSTTMRIRSGVSRCFQGRWLRHFLCLFAAGCESPQGGLFLAGLRGEAQRPVHWLVVTAWNEKLWDSSRCVHTVPLHPPKRSEHYRAHSCQSVTEAHFTCSKPYVSRCASDGPTGLATAAQQPGEEQDSDVCAAPHPKAPVPPGP